MSCRFRYLVPVRVTNNRGRECTHSHALSVKFWLAASSSRQFGRCGFDILASSISSLREFGSINEKIREFSDRCMPHASHTDLASTSAKVSLRSTLRPLILCHTIHACSVFSRALVFRESFRFFAPFSSFFSNPFLGLVTTASLDCRYSCVPHSWGPSGGSRFASGHRRSRCSPTRASF